MSSAIKIAKLEDVLANLDGRLQDKDVLLTAGQATAESSLSFPVTGSDGHTSSFNVAAGLSLAVRSFNNPSDKDPEGVVGGPVPAGDTQLVPVLVPDGEKAFLKYSLQTEVKASGKMAASLVALKGDASLSAIAADYRKHHPSDGIQAAITSDAQGLRVPFQWDDLAALRPDEALTCQIRGRLAASIQVTWSHLASAILPALAGLLQAGTRVCLKSKLGMTVGATLKIEDDFALVFSRREPGWIQLGVHKAMVREVSANAGLGIEVAFEDPAALQQSILSLLDGIAGQEVQTMEAALAKASLDVLDERERGCVERLVSRLGGVDLESGLQRIRDRWEELKGQVQEEARKACEACLVAGFRYNYSRLETHEVLLAADVRDEKLKDFHVDLLCGDLTGIVHWLAVATPAEARLKSYLNQSTIVRTATWGFSLSLPGFTMKGLDRRQTRRKVQERIDGAQAVAYLGSRSYESMLAEKNGWVVDLKADTTRFSKYPAATDLYYGMSLALTHEWGSLEPGNLNQLIDEAIVWRILDEDDEKSIHELLSGLALHKKVATRLELKVDDQPFRGFISRVATLPMEDAMALALARALPWRGNSVARSYVPAREEAYAPLWKLYLANPGISPREMALSAYIHLRNLSTAKDAANWERSNLATPPPGTMAWHVEENPSTAQDVQSFRNGCQSLDQALKQPTWDHTIFPGVFEKMERLWRQFHAVHAMGALLTGPMVGVRPEDAAGVLTIEIDGAESCAIRRS